MKRWERWTFNLLSLAIAVTGFAYLWMKYAMRSDDPFAVVAPTTQVITTSGTYSVTPQRAGSTLLRARWRLASELLPFREINARA